MEGVAFAGWTTLAPADVEFAGWVVGITPERWHGPMKADASVTVGGAGKSRSRFGGGGSTRVRVGGGGTMRTNEEAR